MLTITFILAIIANAFGRRFAGGLLGQWFGNIGGSHVGRAVQAVIAGATVALLAPAWWWGGPVAVAVFAGATMGFPRIGMVPRSVADVVAISVRHGLPATLPVWAVLVVLAPGQPWALWAGVWLALAGILRGPIYWAATLWTPNIPALGLVNLRDLGGPLDPPPWAEFWAGGLMGAALVMALG